MGTLGFCYADFDVRLPWSFRDPDDTPHACPCMTSTVSTRALSMLLVVLSRPLSGTSKPCHAWVWA